MEVPLSGTIQHVINQQKWTLLFVKRNIISDVGAKNWQPIHGLQFHYLQSLITKDRKGAASCVVFYESLVFP